MKSTKGTAKMNTEETNKMIRDALDNFDHEVAQVAADKDKADSPRGWVLLRHEDGRVSLTHKRTTYHYTFSADGKTVTRNSRVAYGGRTCGPACEVATFVKAYSGAKDRLAVKHYNRLSAN